MSRLHTVRVTTTTLGGDLSYGAKLTIATTVYAFRTLGAARLCLHAEERRARAASEWPGVTVEVELESLPDSTATQERTA